MSAPFMRSEIEKALKKRGCPPNFSYYCLVRLGLKATSLNAPERKQIATDGIPIEKQVQPVAKKKGQIEKVFRFN